MKGTSVTFSVAVPLSGGVPFWKSRKGECLKYALVISAIVAVILVGIGLIVVGAVCLNSSLISSSPFSWMGAGYGAHGSGAAFLFLLLLIPEVCITTAKVFCIAGGSLFVGVGLLLSVPAINSAIKQHRSANNVSKVLSQLYGGPGCTELKSPAEETS